MDGTDQSPGLQAAELTPDVIVDAPPTMRRRFARRSSALGARRLIYLPAVSAILAIATGAAAARTAARVATAASPDDEAQKLFRQGVEAARQERWLEAREAFEKAYQLSPRPVLLVNLAGAQARTGRLREAARNYRSILEQRPSPDVAPFRKAAADVLPALEARIPRVTLHGNGLSEADVVALDGDPIAPEHIGRPLPLDPGLHTVVVERSGIERARVSFSLAERESHDISLPEPVPTTPALVAAAPSSAAAGTGADLTVHGALGQPAPATTTWWTSPWFWTAAAVVVAAAVATGVYALDNRDQTYIGNVSPGLVRVK